MPNPTYEEDFEEAVADSAKQKNAEIERIARKNLARADKLFKNSRGQFKSKKEAQNWIVRQWQRANKSSIGNSNAGEVVSAMRKIIREQE